MTATLCQPLELRTEVVAEDADHVRRIIASTNKFRPNEIEVAASLVQEHLDAGDISPYHFLFAGPENQPQGFICYGPISWTLNGFDLYWIGVEQKAQGAGIGRALFTAAEQHMKRLNPEAMVYIETSARPDYEPTRHFYQHRGYTVQGRFADFYAPGDDKLVYVKRL